VAACDRVVGIVCRLRSSNHMPPVHTNFITGLDVDDLARDWRFEVGLACDVAVIYIAD
jgi:hypothetical protein